MTKETSAPGCRRFLTAAANWPRSSSSASVNRKSASSRLSVSPRPVFRAISVSMASVPPHFTVKGVPLDRHPPGLADLIDQLHLAEGLRRAGPGFMPDLLLDDGAVKV